MRHREMGELQDEVLAILWSVDHACTPKEVLDELGDDLAYTTILNVLLRLWNKGVVERERRGRAHAYRPLLSEAELTADRMRTQLDRAGDRRAALSRFVGSLSKRDERALRRILDELDRR